MQFISNSDTHFLFEVLIRLFQGHQFLSGMFEVLVTVKYTLVQCTLLRKDLRSAVSQSK